MGKETPDLSGLFGNLLSNPGALSALSGLLGSLGNPGEKEPPPGGHDKSEATSGEMPPIPTMLSLPSGGGRGKNREGLLGALRPYLSPKRCQALEGACKLLEVIDLFRAQGKGD